MSIWSKLVSSDSRAMLVAGFLTAFLLAEVVYHWIDEPKFARHDISQSERDLKASNPEVLVLSSSHGKTFHVMGEFLSERTSGDVNTVSFALYGGTIRGMQWVLENRIEPILDAKGSSADNLKHLIFGVTYWDSCSADDADPVSVNVPSQAWHFSDYVGDVLTNGFTPHNRNYLRERGKTFFGPVRFVLEPPKLKYFLERLLDKLGVRDYVPPPVIGWPGRGGMVYGLEGWQQMLADTYDCLFSSLELTAMEKIERFAIERDLEFTVVLFPQHPGTIGDDGRPTLQRFANMMYERGSQYGYRVIDVQELDELKAEHYRSDLDHLNDSGNVVFSKWLLDNDLGFLAADSLEFLGD
jgi:hypothetical protein